MKRMNMQCMKWKGRILPHLRKKRLYRRLLLSFLLIFSLPVLLLTLFFYFNTTTLYQEQAAGANRQVAQQIADMLDYRFSDLKNTARRLFADSSLSAYAYSGNPVKGLEAIRTLSDALAVDGLIDDILFYPFDDHPLLAVDGSFSKNAFLQTIMRYETWTPEAFAREVQALEGMKVRPLERVSRASIYATGRYLTVLLPDTGLSPSGILLMLISETSMRKLLSAYPCETILLDPDGALIAATQAAEPLLSPENRDALLAPTGDALLRLGGQAMLKAMSASRATGWTVLCLRPSDALMARLRTIPSTLLAALLLAFLLGGAVIGGLLRRVYRPIRALHALIDPASDAEDELAVVEHSIRQMRNRNEELQHWRSHHEPLLRNDLFARLIRGQYTAKEDFLRDAEGLSIDLPHGHFRVAIVQAEQAEPVDYNEELFEELEGGLLRPLTLYCIRGADDRRLTLLINVGQADAPLLAPLSRLQEYLRDQWNIACTIGVSTDCPDVGRLWRAYIEASNALAYRLLRGGGSILFTQEDTHDTARDVPASITAVQREQLALCIKGGQRERLETLLDDMAERIRDANSLFLARCMCFEIINCVLREIATLPQDPSQENPFNVDSLVRFETVDELIGNVKRLCTDVLDYASLLHDRNRHATLEDIERYIVGHCFEPSFAVQEVAGAVGLSPSSLHSFFKSMTGMSVSEYVQTLQIERAKLLLLESDEPIQAIVEKVGYLDASSFIRKFKQRVGVTPGKFRLIAQEERVRRV